jgi:quercetin dioxygenase-like cupin family protein
MSQDSQPRLREHPVSRFEGDHHVFDLNALATELRGEAHEATEGHRQIALYHYGSVTTVLFAFDAGGALEEHQANGVVSIQVLDGAISVGVPGHKHELGAGQMLVLSPNVRHDVRATQASRMLLTVHLHGGKHDDAPHRDSERDTTERTP